MLLSDEPDVDDIKLRVYEWAGVIEARRAVDECLSLKLPADQWLLREGPVMVKDLKEYLTAEDIVSLPSCLSSSRALLHCDVFLQKEVSKNHKNGKINAARHETLS